MEAAQFGSGRGVTPESTSDWPFDQPPNAAAITVRSVLDGAPILFVSHDEDDDGWQFLDGNEVNQDEARIVGMGTAFRLDPTLADIADLPPGWIAWRDGPGMPWRRAAKPR